MLIDVHAHFFPERSARADWREYNASRLRAGERIGITVHLNSVLGTFGRSSPTYFPSPADVTYGNEWAFGLQREQPRRVRTYVCVNPNYSDHALAEIETAGPRAARVDQHHAPASEAHHRGVALAEQEPQVEPAARLEPCRDAGGQEPVRERHAHG